MNQTNCPNCGAVITGPECEYCGTRFNIRVEEPEETTVTLYVNGMPFITLVENETREISGLDPRWGIRRRINLG